MNILTKGFILEAEQWLAWRNEGKSTNEIAEILGISSSMVRIIARKFKAAGYPDPQYKKTKPGPSFTIDITTDTGAYILGILWGILSKVEEQYIVRHKDIFFLSLLKEHLEIESSIQKRYSPTDTQYRLKISRGSYIKSIDALLTSQGWTSRNNKKRPYPSGPVNDKGFIRAWIELHSSADIHRTGRKRIPMPRLRIYGNMYLITEINDIISANTNLNQREIQKTSNKTTKALYYVSKSFQTVFDWLYKDFEIYNPIAREHFNDVLSWY